MSLHDKPQSLRPPLPIAKLNQSFFLYFYAKNYFFQSLEKSSNEKDTHIEDQPLDKSANENCSGNLNDEENERVVTPDLSVPVDIMPPPSVQIIKGTFFGFKKFTIFYY